MWCVCGKVDVLYLYIYIYTPTLLFVERGIFFESAAAADRRPSRTL